jgi:hypothetical protein
VYFHDKPYNILIIELFDGKLIHFDFINKIWLSRFITNKISEREKMNKKQKVTLIIAAAVIAAAIIVWRIYGGELFTKTQVLVDKKDELFGWTEKVWINKFVWGLDLTAIISAITIVFAGALWFIFKDKKPKKELS